MSDTLKVRVYYEDTDAGGIVYHARYLAFMERGRTEFLRRRGLVQSSLFDEDLQFVVRQMTIDFHRPARLDDQLLISTNLLAIKGAKLLMRQMIDHDGSVLIAADVTVAAISRAGRPRRLPPIVHELLMS